MENHTNPSSPGHTHDTPVDNLPPAHGSASSLTASTNLIRNPSSHPTAAEAQSPSINLQRTASNFKTLCKANNLTPTEICSLPGMSNIQSV